MISRSRPALLVAIAAALFGVAGCASPGHPPVASITSAAPPTAAPSASAPAEPVHTMAFGGDCANVLDEATAGDILGGVASVDAWRSGSSGGTGTLGGIWCTWSVADVTDRDQDLPSGLSVRVVSSADVTSDIFSEVATARCDPWYDTSVCRLGRTVDGLWIVASTSGISTEPDGALLARAIDVVAARASAYAAPVRVAATDARWVTPSCDELGVHMRLEEILGDGYVTGWWEANPSAQLEYRHTEAMGVEKMCEWLPSEEGRATAPQGITMLTVWPDGAWDADRLLADGEQIVLIGGEHAVVSPDGLSASAIDGANAVRVRVDVYGDAVDTLERFFAAQSPE